MLRTETHADNEGFEKVLAKGEFPFTYLKISLLKSLILPFNILILELWQTSSIPYQTLELEDIKNKLNRWPWVNSWPCWCRPHFVALNISKLQFYTFQLEKKLQLSSKIQFNLQAQIVSKHTYLHWEKKKKKKPWREKKTMCTPPFERSIVPNVLL